MMRTQMSVECSKCRCCMPGVAEALIERPRFDGGADQGKPRLHRHREPRVHQVPQHPLSLLSPPRPKPMVCV